MDVFGGAPRFLAYPRPVMVQSGTDAVLKCQIGGDPRPAVIWERNNEKINPQGRYRVFEDGNVYNLIISAVTTEDSGQYICKAKNSIGETYAAATLKVEGEAQEMELREENKPRFLIKPLSTRVGRGEDSVFSCKLWGNPRPEVVWEKDGRRLNEIFESTHFSVGYQDGGWFQLKIFKTRAPDGGVYTCKARNEFGEALAGAVLLVDAGPGHEEEGNLKMFAVTEGKHAKFRCFVTGKPKPEIIWRKDGRLILSGRRYLLYEDREGYFTLKVLYCKQKDNGVYVCAASNTAGQTLSAVHLSVKEPPVRFKQPLIDLEVWERDLAVLECEVPEDSVPITWYLEDRRLQPGAKYGMEEWGTKRRLTIRDIGVDDDGIYLCEMPDGGRSIAEVAVKGTILRKLPRKVDVLEGENAAFCVEVEKEEMDIHWYKDSIELRETHQTILKSFGRTHILVFVNTMPQDSGLVTFLVGRSKTSSHICMSLIEIKQLILRANAALLSWVPSQDSRKNPPSGYVLERQEVGTGSQEWLQCLTTDSATSVEILGDSVPCEADYRFRICSVNKYGKSNNVEFPKAVHLVPVARIQAPLQDALVPEGQDGLFSIELSASVIGTWFLNGTQLQEDERYSMRRSRTHQSLRIRGVRDIDNGAEITFIAYGIRDSAALYIQGFSPLFSAIPDAERNKTIQTGNPIVLRCELSDPSAQVYWYKDGSKLHPQTGVDILTDGLARKLIVHSAEFFHSGLYCCKTKGDTITFSVDIKAPPVKFSAIPETMRTKSIEAGCPIVLQCVVSDPEAHVCWFKDEMQLISNSGLEIHSEGNTRTLVVQSDDTMEFQVEIKGDFTLFILCVNISPKSFSFSDQQLHFCKVSISSVLILFSCPEFPMLAIPVTYSTIFDVERTKSLEAGKLLELECEVADSTVPVYWYKDGVKLFPQNDWDIQSNGTLRRLIIPSAEVLHSGLYSCETSDDTMHFTVDIKAPPVRITTLCEAERNKSVEVGEPIVLRCEISDPNTQVTWYKDGIKLHEAAGQDMLAEGSIRTLAFQSAMLSHAGIYSCKTRDDAMQFHVDVKAPPVTFADISEEDLFKSVVEQEELVLSCEVTRADGVVQWYKDGAEMQQSNNITMQAEDTKRNLTIHSAQLSDTGTYTCRAGDNVLMFKVKIRAGKEDQRMKMVGPLNDLFEKVAGETLVLDCEVSRSNAEVTWKKNGEEVEDSRNITILEDGVIRQLTVHSLTLEDSGQYVSTSKCRGFYFNLRMSYNEILAHHILVAGDDLILECEVSRPNATVQWLWNGKILKPDTRIQIHRHDIVRKLVLSGLQPSDSGKYICDAIDDKLITIVEPPVKFLDKEASKNVTAYENESVTLCATVSRERANVRWLKDGQLLNGDNIHISSEGNTHKLTINPLQLSDSGEYVCDVNTDEMYFSLLVKEMMVKFIRPLENIVSPKGSSLILRCEINKPKGDVQWLKDGQEICPSRRHTIRAQGRERSFTIHQLVEEDAGEYACESTDDRTSATVTVEIPRVVEFISELRNITVCEGEDAVFKCVVSPEDTELVWRLNGKQVALNEHTVISSNGLCHMLCIHNCMVSDSSRVTADAEGLVSEAELQVQGELWPHPLILQLYMYIFKMTPVVAEEYSDATLEVEVSLDSGEVQWMRQGVLIHPGAKYTLKHNGRKHSLTIHKLAMSDRGTYSCETLHDRTVVLVLEHDGNQQVIDLQPKLTFRPGFLF
uniref:Obscurin like cytoskeletal adaptor 1b n=1 Tax=Dicentrarchus labrax TaxID=13489 RepID=A0A8C4E6N2_DICLA